MKLIIGSINKDESRDVFWQRSFIETEESHVKVIICASQEFLATTFGRRIGDIRIDTEVCGWFEEKTKNVSYSSAQGQVVISLYPEIVPMLEFAKTL